MQRVITSSIVAALFLTLAACTGSQGKFGNFTFKNNTPDPGQPLFFGGKLSRPLAVGGQIDIAVNGETLVSVSASPAGIVEADLTDDGGIRVIGLAAGTTELTVVADDGTTDALELAVADVDSVEINAQRHGLLGNIPKEGYLAEHTPALAPGASFTLEATLRDASGTILMGDVNLDWAVAPAEAKQSQSGREITLVVPSDTDLITVSVASAEPVQLAVSGAPAVGTIALRDDGSTIDGPLLLTAKFLYLVHVFGVTEDGTPLLGRLDDEAQAETFDAPTGVLMFAPAENALLISTTGSGVSIHELNLGAGLAHTLTVDVQLDTVAGE